MEEVSLISFLKRVPSFQQTVFPVDAERCISAERLPDVLAHEEKDACEENTVAHKGHGKFTEFNAQSC